VPRVAQTLELIAGEVMSFARDKGRVEKK
jgi:hypothetical protein